MTVKFFVDTNVLLYAGSNAVDDQAKRHIARGLLTAADIGFSAQVLQEFYAVAVTKQRLRMTHVYSEDLNAGQVYDGVTVVNPFVGVAP